MSQASDWTTGPAKWAAVCVLGSASIFGIGWSVWNGSRPAPVMPVSKPVEVDVGDHADDAGDIAPAPALAETASATRRIDLNKATAAELELLPGIGPALAGRILEYRKTNGAFKSVDQLDDVKGIGPRTLEKLRPLVKVE